MPSGPVAREEEVVERITRDTDSGETAENSKIGWEGKEISRAVVRSVIEQTVEAQDTVTKNEFNWSAVKKLRGDEPEGLTSPRLANSRHNLATSVTPLSLSRQWSRCARLKSATSTSLKRLYSAQARTLLERLARLYKALRSLTDYATLIGRDPGASESLSRPNKCSKRRPLSIPMVGEERTGSGRECQQ